MTLQKLVFFCILGIQSLAAAEAKCVKGEEVQYQELGATVTVRGALRTNAFFAEDQSLVSVYPEIAYVLESATSLMVDSGGWETTVACAYNQFTLHLTPEQFQLVQEMMERGQQVQITGSVGLAESSIEEAGNATLKNVVIQDIL